jgi:metalloendopeptidase OMA1, mitochondrial
MLPRLVQSPLLWRRAVPSIARHALPRPAKPRALPPPIRPFSGSSLRSQTYRYRRFGDPEPSGGYSSGGSKGPTSGWLGRFNLFWRRLSRIQQLFLVGVGGGAPVFYVSHLETVPESGRRRFIFMSESMEEEMGQAVPFKYPLN